MDIKLSTEQTLHTNENFKELSTIVEEALSVEHYINNTEVHENLSSFDLGTNLPPAIEHFDIHGDSDESLGILPIDLLDDENEDFYQNSKDFLSFVKIDCEHDFIDNLNIVKENVFKANDLLMKYEDPGLSTVYSSELQHNLNDPQAVYLAEEQDSLNMTVMFHNHTVESDDKFQAVAIKINDCDEECQSPVCTLPNILSHSKCEESPIHKDASSIKYASTPKQGINTTFALDESFLNSEQNLSPVSNLNKTYNKEDSLQDKVILANVDKLDPVDIISNDTVVLSPETGKNFLNIGTPSHYQNELNKTFNVSTIAEEINVTINYPENIDKRVNLIDNKSDEIQITASDNEKDATYANIFRNISNSTISFPKELENKTEALNLEEHEVPLENALNILPATTDFENASYEEGISSNVLDKTQILNTTFNKMDELPQSSKTIESSEFQKHLCKQVGATNDSKIAKEIYSSPFLNSTFNSKSNKPDKKNIRKTTCVPTKTLNKEALKRRQTIGTISVEIDKELPQASKVESSEFQKPLCKQVGVTNTSKIAKGIYSSPFLSSTSSRKSIKPDDKRSIRKSMSIPTKTLDKEASKKRQTFGPMSIETDDVIDQNLISQATKNSIKGKSRRESLKLTSKSKNSCVETPRTSNDISFSMSRVSSGNVKVAFPGEDDLKLKRFGKTVIMTENTVTKEAILPTKKTFNKYEIPRVTAQASSAKISVPIPKQVLQKTSISSTEFRGNKISLFGIPEKSVLSQKNSSDAGVPGASCIQTLKTRKSGACGSSTNNYQTESLASKIPTTTYKKMNNEGSSTNNYQTESLASKIPTTTYKKMNNEEKAVAVKPKTYVKNLSHRNLW